MKCPSILLLALLPLTALATTPKPTTPPASTAASHSSADAHAAAAALSHSAATQSQSLTGGDQSQVATGGDATAITGPVSATTGPVSADNAGNVQSTEFNYPRQAPSTAQGSLMIGACGAGGNAGGSNTGGSAFLGLAWTPADCKLLLAAAAYQALGMSDSACEMVNGISAVKKRWKELGVDAPSCEVQKSASGIHGAADVHTSVPVVVQVPPQDMSGYATKQELQEAFKRSVAK